jgi:UPF0755 protein
VADRSSRTAQEREAARLERERRRAQQEGRPLPAVPPAVESEPEVDGASAVPPTFAPVTPAGHDGDGDALVGHQDGGDDEHAGYQGDPLDGHVDPGDGADEQHDGHPDGADETGEHEYEMASGTRRVSRAEGMAARGSQGGGRARPSSGSRGPRRAGHGRQLVANRRHSWLGRILTLFAVVLAAALVWFLIEVFEPFGASPHGEVTVLIPARATSSEIGDLLARDGVIRSSFFFEVRATLSGDRSALRAGVYHLEKGMSYGAVLAKLTTIPPAAKVTELTVVDGRRRAQINALLRSQHVAGSYLAATRSSPLLNFRAYGLHRPPPTLEGFLFPDTYQLVEPIKISDLVDDQLMTFKQQFAKVNTSFARRKNLTPYDVLKIASLIEAEVPSAHDRPLVASVIYNRLADHMFLGFDSTTSYATGNFSNHLTVSQLHSKSAYNTFTHLGLPPTPINNPGLAAIQAAAHPARTHYLYFFTTPCRHNSVFATSFAQFTAQNQLYASKHC